MILSTSFLLYANAALATGDTVVGPSGPGPKAVEINGLLPLERVILSSVLATLVLIPVVTTMVSRVAGRGLLTPWPATFIPQPKAVIGVVISVYHTIIRVVLLAGNCVYSCLCYPDVKVPFVLNLAPEQSLEQPLLDEVLSEVNTDYKLSKLGVLERDEHGYFVPIRNFWCVDGNHIVNIPLIPCAVRLQMALGLHWPSLTKGWWSVEV
jgi:hypothetical protein